MLHTEKAGRPYAAQAQQTLISLSSKDLFCVHCRALHVHESDSNESDESESSENESDENESDENESDENESDENESDGDDGERMRRFFRKNPPRASYIMAQPQFIALRQMHERNGTDLYGDRRLHDLVIRLRRS